jgi:hypothetical protein
LFGYTVSVDGYTALIGAIEYRSGNYNNSVYVFTKGGGNEPPDAPGTPTEPKTPGFELVFVICAIAVSILLWKKKRIV